MIRGDLIKRFSSYSLRIISRQNSSSQINIEKLEQESAVANVIDDEAIQKEEEIERKRNKSRLKPHDFNMLHDQNPYPEPSQWYHGTLKYLRRNFGRYGTESGVDPAICWPTPKELAVTKEYERVAFPYSIQEVVAAAKQRRKEKIEQTRLRQEQIVERIAKLEDMKKDLFNRIAKKEAEARAVKERKERLIEEVRRHFGYTVDPRDEKFKEMLEKKEKEQKKLMKEQRRKEKEEKMVDKMLKKKDVAETVEAKSESKQQ